MEARLQGSPGPEKCPLHTQGGPVWFAGQLSPHITPGGSGEAQGVSRQMITKPLDNCDVPSDPS